MPRIARRLLIARDDSQILRLLLLYTLVPAVLVPAAQRDSVVTPITRQQLWCFIGMVIPEKYRYSYAPWCSARSCVELMQNAQGCGKERCRPCAFGPHRVS
jgi:hypothetical protein